MLDDCAFSEYLTLYSFIMDDYFTISCWTYVYGYIRLCIDLGFGFQI